MACNSSGTALPASFALRAISTTARLSFDGAVDVVTIDHVRHTFHVHGSGTHVVADSAEGISTHVTFIY
ncbi:MAG: hypothetical protein LKJ18_09915 [Ancrocorticia sp.]|nr:hypothetical protein [Ancrocorticia sp.]MCI2002250.1 hypothetical protein [Ancrocorticia sp.]